MNISTQAVYQARKRHNHRQIILATIKTWKQEYRMLMPRIGGRNLYRFIKPLLLVHGIKLGRDAFFAYLRQHNLLVKPKRSYTQTTWSKHWLKKNPNLLKEANKPKQTDKVLIADITYVKSKQGTHYLSLVTDAYSRRIVGYHVSDNMTAEDVVKALDMATSKNEFSDCIHHSDRRVQYASEIYQQALAKANITPSMTDSYDCYQNALAERVNGILKSAFLLYECNTLDELRQLVKQLVNIYNGVRLNLSLNMKIPNKIYC